MNRILTFATLFLVLLAAPQYTGAQSADSEMRTQFEAVIDGLNDNSFRKFHDAIDERSFLNRVFGTRVLENEVKESFAGSFSELIETMFTGQFPRPRNEEEMGEVIGTIIAFSEEAGQARAIVRYESKNYRFSYHSYDLVSGRGGRVNIVDWFDYYQGSWFSEDVGDMLVTKMPSKRSVAAILEINNPSEAQLFQAGELLKAAGAMNPNRFFQIIDGLDDVLRKDPFVVTLNFGFCRYIGALTRLDAAAAEVVAQFPADVRFSLSLAEYYIQRRLFAEAIVEYERLQGEGGLGMKDGATESLKATSAMAAGEFERAQEFALSATQVEPTLELGWWTLLRARTAAQNYSGATEALSQLEDRFGYLLIPQKLQRDRFLRILIDQQEYKDWRAARDQA